MRLVHSKTPPGPNDLVLHCCRGVPVIWMDMDTEIRCDYCSAMLLPDQPYDPPHIGVHCPSCHRNIGLCGNASLTDMLITAEATMERVSC